MLPGLENNSQIEEVIEVNKKRKRDHEEEEIEEKNKKIKIVGESIVKRPLNQKDLHELTHFLLKFMDSPDLFISVISITDSENEVKFLRLIEMFLNINSISDVKRLQLKMLRKKLQLCFSDSVPFGESDVDFGSVMDIITLGTINALLNFIRRKLEASIRPVISSSLRSWFSKEIVENDAAFDEIENKVRKEFHISEDFVNHFLNDIGIIKKIN